MRGSRYHYTCARQIGALPESLRSRPFVNPGDVFLCPDHQAYAGDVLVKALPFLPNVYQRDWLRRPSPPHAFHPQLDDTVVYFPQGHLQHLLEFGDADVPFTQFACCVCRVVEQRFAFPNHLCRSNSILEVLKLQVVAVPDPGYQTSGDAPKTFVRPTTSLPVFQATLRDCDLPDFLVSLQNYVERMGQSWAVGSHFEMEFQEESAWVASMTRRQGITKYGGTVVRFRPNPVWFGSPWEAAEIRWDNEGGSQVISLFETKSTQPAVTSIPLSIRARLVEEIKALSAEEFAGECFACGET